MVNGNSPWWTEKSTEGGVRVRVRGLLDRAGQPQGESVKLLESYPGFPGEPRWERVISEDGKAVRIEAEPAGMRAKPSPP